MIPGNARNKLIDDYAHLQYCRTLKCLRGLISGDPNRPTELTVISCYLLVVFEFLRGDYMTAMVHVRCGFNILRQGAGSLQSMTSLKQELFRVFSFGNIQAPPARQPSKADHHFDTHKRFSTLEEAAISLSFWVARLHNCQPLSRLYQRVEALKLTPLSLAAPGEDLNIDTENSHTNMDALLAKMKTAINESTPNRAAVMKMDMIVNFVLLTGAQEIIGESIYVTLEPHFREIVSLATSVISPLDGVKPRVEEIVAACNSETALGTLPIHRGVIYPLFFTAVKCQNAEVRRQAISLLVTSPWREGPWDSARVAASLHEKRMFSLNGFAN
ncbi:hypothetical protein ABVK25_001308 [Lepraria finkii]|uniref:Uncharacterized protein n=1 Tax=Lepraria finkii TaxID=1340010 RepID=A0ABR4BLA0_9LECA